MAVVGAQVIRFWPLTAAVLALSLCLRTPAFASEGPLRLAQTRGPDGIVVSAENSDPYAVRWVWVSFNAAQNARAVPPLPAGFVLRPRERRRLFTVRPFSAGESYSYGLSELSGEGDPTRGPDPQAVYLLPFAHGTKHLVSQGYFGRVSHQGLYALDFAMADGTAIDAARAGVVIAVKQDSDVGGPSALYAKDGNYIEVMHADATWAIYAHLRQGGARVRRGQRVGAGQEIGLSGHTGEASGPHLHFAVYRAAWDGPRTIPTVFLTGPSATASIEEGRTYYSYHPGGARFTPVLGEDLRDADFRGITRTARGSGVNVRYDLVDRRNLVWADNATDQDVDLSVDLEQSQGVRPSVGLPFHIHVPARTEVYCFHVDYVGEGPSSFQLNCSWLAPRD
jgi:murein DD-endopeptidase MepM/ murein hydrolase activator NlpD